jgi:hypothetical protein
MGNLKPGATYIYEQADGITYAREFGADPSTRRPIGWDFKYKDLTLESINHQLWKDIQCEAKSNPTLQKALDHVIMLYRLSKDNPL